MITNRTLALLRLAPAHLPDQLAAAPNQVVRVKHEQYGGSCSSFLAFLADAQLRYSEWDVDSYVSYSPSLRLGAVNRAAETEWDGSVAGLAREVLSWHGPSQVVYKVVYIKHEHNVGLVGNLMQLADVVPPRPLGHLAAPDRDTAKRMSRMAVDDVSHVGDENVGSDTIIASSFPGSRGEGREDRIGSGKVSE
ncbi:hypothetical protein EDB89DRAFT_2085213 [Lactarius sanguifluus]|nr:hypothetical protein EDB89DRAFT_2085213 [Lactarius sanguifluus]